MAWGKLYAFEQTSDNQSFDTSTITANKSIQILFTQFTHTGNSALYFNGDGSSGNYAWRVSANGGADSTTTSNNKILNQLTGGTADTNSFTVAYFVNIGTEEKLSTSQTVHTGTAGSGNAPFRTEFASKWSNTSNQITQIQVDDDGGAGFDTGSSLSVLGSELTPAPAKTIETGSIYIDTDTNQRYFWNGSSWSLQA